jgi:hypothetical protein
MRAARMVLVLILLSAMTSAAEAQLLPRRRVAVRVGEMMADFGARMTMEGRRRVSIRRRASWGTSWTSSFPSSSMPKSRWVRRPGCT